MSHATATTLDAATTHRHTILAEPPPNQLTFNSIAAASAPHVNRFPSLGALREGSSSGPSPCPPSDVIPSPRRGGDEIPPPGACDRHDDHDYDNGTDQVNRSAYVGNVGIDHRARDIVDLHGASVDTHERGGRHYAQLDEEEQEDEEEGSMTHYEVANATHTCCLTKPTHILKP